MSKTKYLELEQAPSDPIMDPILEEARAMVEKTGRNGFVVYTVEPRSLKLFKGVTKAGAYLDKQHKLYPDQAGICDVRIFSGDATNEPSSSAAPARKRRHLTAEGRKRLIQMMKKRWAERQARSKRQA